MTPLSFETRPYPAQHAFVPVDVDHDGTILLNEQFGGTGLWKDGVLRQLVLPAGVHESRGIAIRDGKVLASTPMGDRLWTAFDTSEKVPGGMNTMALNGSGLITGWTSAPGLPETAAVWSPGGSVTTLPAPVDAYGIVVGDNGEIAGALQAAATTTLPWCGAVAKVGIWIPRSFGSGSPS